MHFWHTNVDDSSSVVEFFARFKTIFLLVIVDWNRTVHSWCMQRCNNQLLSHSTSSKLFGFFFFLTPWFIYCSLSLFLYFTQLPVLLDSPVSRAWVAFPQLQIHPVLCFGFGEIFIQYIGLVFYWYRFGIGPIAELLPNQNNSWKTGLKNAVYMCTTVHQFVWFVSGSGCSSSTMDHHPPKPQNWLYWSVYCVKQRLWFTGLWAGKRINDAVQCTLSEVKRCIGWSMEC